MVFSAHKPKSFVDPFCEASHLSLYRVTAAKYFQEGGREGGRAAAERERERGRKKIVREEEEERVSP